MPQTVRLTSDALVGRDDELAAVLGTVRGVAEGRPCVVTVSGAAGIGKTRFVSAVGDALRSDGLRVMAGGCLDLGTGAPPYSALIAAFRSVDPPAVQVLDALTGAVEMRRSRLFELLRGTMVALARRRPTVLVVEDVHWSDRITRDALLYVLAMAREGRWALVATFRDDEVRGRPPVRGFVERLHREAIVRVALDPLPVDAVARQIRGITGRQPASADAARVHRRSGGIPLLVEEVVAADAAGLLGMPHHVRDLFLSRVRGAGTRAARAVEVVAVAGDRCGTRLVAEVLRVDAAHAARALDRAVAADVLSADGAGYRMRHDLLREAVYESLPPGRRRQLHGQVAAALASDPRADPLAVAHHWHEAEEPARAVLASLAAADAAERVHAPATVRTHLERVLDNWAALDPSVAQQVGGRAGVLLRAAAAAELEGSFDRAAALARDGVDLLGSAAPSEGAAGLERLMIYRWRSGDGRGAEAAFRDALTTLPADAAPAIRARVLSGCAWFLTVSWRLAEAAALSVHALAAAEESGDDLELSRALLSWGYARADTLAGLAALERARALAGRLDAGELLARAHLALDLALWRQGRLAEREAGLREGLRVVAAHGVGGFEAALRHQLVEALLDRGGWDEADALLRDLAAVGVRGVPGYFALAHSARLAALRGDVATAVQAAKQALAIAREIPRQPVPAVTALLALAETSLWAGRPADAAPHVAEAARLAAADTLLAAPVAATSARIAADVVVVARTHGQEAAAALPSSPAARIDDPHPVRAAHAATAHAELSRCDRGRDPAPWQVAVAAWDALGDPYRAAYCRWRLAHALLRSRSGRREAARELDSARAVAAALAAQPLLSAVTSLAASARLHLAGPSPIVAADRMGLTSRELEIVPLLVAGRTNAEIADALVISPRTVGVHVSRILHKLGAARRTEAADIARRCGLVAH